MRPRGRTMLPTRPPFGAGVKRGEPGLWSPPPNHDDHCGCWPCVNGRKLRRQQLAHLRFGKGRFRAQQSADNGIISGPWEQGPAVSDAIIYDADGKAIGRMDKVTRERKPL